jgi:type VI secretion system Hcp family effector
MRFATAILGLALLCSVAMAEEPGTSVRAKVDGIDGEMPNNMIGVLTLSGEWTRNTASQILSKIKMEKRPQSVKFTKLVDKTTPELVKRASDGVSIVSVQFYFYTKMANAPEVNYFTITLKNVTITKSSLTLDAAGKAMEEVLLDYEHCDLKSVTGNTEFHTEK